MDAKTLEDMINDPAVSDDAVFDATVEQIADKKDANGNHVPPTEQELADNDRLRELTIQKRPAVWKRIGEYVRDMFCPKGFIP